MELMYFNNTSELEFVPRFSDISYVFGEDKQNKEFPFVGAGTTTCCRVPSPWSASATPPQLSCKISILQVKGRGHILQVYTPAAESGSNAFKIPPSIHQCICVTFDSANSKGKDWQLLQHHVHCLWETQHQTSGDVDSLACALEEIDRAPSPGIFTPLGQGSDRPNSGFS
ncbi:unnamed protein product [Gadus morhua 'NCC']